MSGRAELPFLARAREHGERVAIVDPAGEHLYAEARRAAGATARALLDAAERGAGDEAAGRDSDLREARVAFMAAPGLPYLAALWGIWRAGGMAVPLCTDHPPRELAHVLDDAGVSLALAGREFVARLEPLARERGVPLLDPEAARRHPLGPDDGCEPGGGDEAETATAPARSARPHDETRGAMLLYTSGTTSRPKGVVHTHASLRAQVESLVEAWAWRPDDRILHVLPLHHTHGIVNALLCALHAGAACEMLPAFDAGRVWDRFAAGPGGEVPAITLFMAVPTIYVKLIAAWEEADAERRARWSEGARSLRLVVSGSAALPERTFRRWREISGHDLLERYGMTEIGMALSNPLEGERRPGTVGRPLPGVRMRLVGESGEVLASDEGPSADPPTADAGGDAPPGEPSPRGPAPSLPPDAGPGEIHVCGPTLFREYWGRPEATAEAFDEGWFRTGDVAAIEDGYWRILGRDSVDIIKSGGYKISALEIEEVLRAHPGVAECAVVGLPDREWGERVAAAVVPATGQEPDGAVRPGRAAEPDGAARPGEAAEPDAAEALLEALDAWARERLAGYKVPRRWELVERLPRNALGKVRKPDVAVVLRRRSSRIREQEASGGS